MKYYQTKTNYVAAWRYDGLGKENAPKWLKALEKDKNIDFHTTDYNNTIMIDSWNIVYDGNWIVCDENENLEILTDEDFNSIYEEVL